MVLVVSVLACIANAKTDLLLGQFDGRIPYILAAATNLVLVMLTGKCLVVVFPPLAEG
jgi:hypothetical protein